MSETEQEWKVAPDAAEVEFSRFTEAWRIDTGTEDLDDEDTKSFKSTKRRIMLAIQKGLLTVDETGENLQLTLEFPLANVEKLVMSPPKGSALTKWDAFKEKQQVKKINATMGDMCKCNPAVFAQMDMRDLKKVQAVNTLFLVG